MATKNFWESSVLYSSLLFISFFTTFIHLGNAQEPIVINPKLSEATLYLKGCEMKFEESLSLQKGEQILKISFPEKNNNLIYRSLRIDGEGIRVTNVREKNDLIPSKVDNSKEIASLKDSIKQLQKALDWKAQELQVFQQERKILDDNSKLTGQEERFAVDELSKFTSFYRTKQFEIRNLEVENKEAQAILKRKISALNSKISKLQNAQKSSRKRSLLVNVRTENSVKGQLKVSFYSSGASWSPVYTFEAPGKDKPLRIKMEAEIYQQTYMNWDSIPLVFSNAKPADDQRLPRLEPIFASYLPDTDTIVTFDPETYEEKIGIIRNSMDYESLIAEMDGQNYFSYRVERPQTIPHGSSNLFLFIKELELPAIYEYVVYASLSNKVYLVSKVSQFSSHNLLPGKVILYSEGQYMGESFLDDLVFNDQMEVSLGEVPGILLERDARTFTSPKVLSGNEVKDYKVTLTAKNNKSFPLTLRVTDQIPVSMQKGIELKLDKADGATVNETDGYLHWEIPLKPGQSKEWHFSYEMKYPEKEFVVIKRR